MNKDVCKGLISLSGATNLNAWIVDVIKEYIGRSILEIGAGIGNITVAMPE